MKSFLSNSLAIFSQLKISHKLWIGFGSLVALLAIVSLTALNNLTSARHNLTTVVEVDQPTVFVSMELADALDRTNAALGFYLLSKAERDKAEYEKTLKLLDKLVGELGIGVPAQGCNTGTRVDRSFLNLLHIFEPFCNEFGAFFIA